MLNASSYLALPPVIIILAEVLLEVYMQVESLIFVSQVELRDREDVVFK